MLPTFHVVHQPVAAIESHYFSDLLGLQVALPAALRSASVSVKYLCCCPSSPTIALTPRQRFKLCAANGAPGGDTLRTAVLMSWAAVPCLRPTRSLRALLPMFPNLWAAQPRVDRQHAARGCALIPAERSNITHALSACALLDAHRGGFPSARRPERPGCSHQLRFAPRVP